ncbi:hypothetical protein [Vagococcus fluvialis]|uniref:hypothetical protein n=1 Tax=Vagococcus fluvialis TaxID=2738 RepID=UPI003B22253F
MGLWYFMIIFLGIALLVVGLRNKDVTRSNKIVTMSLIVGTLLVGLGLILFLPGSSSVLEQLLQIN